MIRRLQLGLLLVALLVTGVAMPVQALEPGADPAINRPYRSPDFEEWVARFERPGREVYDKRGEIVAALELRPGMAVADIGAGTGLFTRLFAAKVGPSGKVYAVDISRAFVENILRSARGQGLDNVVGIVNTQTDTLLPPGSIDLAYVCDTYHHFEHAQQMLRSIHRALRPEGALVIIDYKKIEGVSSGWIMHHVRAGEEAVINEVEAAGFKLVGKGDFLARNYFLRFKRAGSGSR